MSDDRQSYDDTAIQDELVLPPLTEGNPQLQSRPGPQQSHSDTWVPPVGSPPLEPPVWDAYERGEYTGFSVQGSGRRRPRV